MWNSTDYQLDWPRELLRGELVALCTHPHRAWTAGEVELLLTEAFHTGVPAADFARASSLGRDWIGDLQNHLDEVHEYAPPRPYWPARRTGPASAVSPRDHTTGHQEFADLISELKILGYLDHDFGEPCPSQWDFNVYDTGGGELAPTLEHQLGQSELWPLQPETWDTDTFYGLIEVFHDLVARPRWRWNCDHNDYCGVHSTDFDIEAGRRVYRALVNRLLQTAGIELRLAESGEDAGRLVHVVDEARADLIERALDTPDPEVAGRVEHAIALFRGRDATEHDKRSAAITLAGILEERRALIRTEIGRKDEGALFGLANEFAIRHQRRGQQGDYDPAFLDWIVWWYLATIALTDQIIARQDSAPAAGTA